jgi:hypothetical protein
MPIGGQPSEETWEPWANMRDTAALHNYLSANNLEKLIPKKYKISVVLT